MDHLDKTLICIGRVLPEVLEVSIDVKNRIHYQDPEGAEGLFDIRILQGDVRVEINLSDENEGNLSWAVIRALELVTSKVDLYAFTLGYALQVIFDFTIHNGSQKPLVLSHASVRQFVPDYSDSEMEVLDELIRTDLDCRLAIRDLILSLSTLNYSAIAACRAVEALRNKFREGDEGDGTAWKRMRDTLNIDREYLQIISEASKKPRHGHRGAALLFDQSDITHRAWQVVCRFFDWHLLGRPDSLPPTYNALKDIN